MKDINKYEKGTLGWLRKQQRINANKDGFGNVDDWLKWKIDPFNILEKKYGKEFAYWARQNKGKVPDAWLNAGCKNRTEYGNRCAQKSGYKDEAEQNQIRRYNNGEQLPMEFNEHCTSNFGIDKGERIFKRFLEENIFEDVKGSGKCSCDRGIDFTCKNHRQEFIDKYPQFKLERDKEYKIQLRVRCLDYNKTCDHNGWTYNIFWNNIADLFILSAWDSRDNMNPMHIWIFHKDDMVRIGKSYIKDKFWR